MRILVIEDETELARHVSSALARQGHSLRVAHDGPTGLQAAREETPDLIVLDLNLPRLDGLELLGELRRLQSPARVLILTARSEVDQRVKGLKAGADDYLTKPFSIDEVLARVEAIGRRCDMPKPGDLLRVADLHFDVPHRHVTRAGAVVELSPRELDVLQVLMEEPGRVFSRSELCERVWQRDHEYDTRTVDIFITRLRRKIDTESREPLFRTVPFVGYAIQPPA